MLRGEDMVICDVYIQTDAGFDVLYHIGEMECVQFLDMNRNVWPIEKTYMNELCRCDDLERNLNYIHEEIKKENVHVLRLRGLSHIKPLHPTEMFEFENMIETWTKDVKDMSANNFNLQKMRSETKEIHYVLQHLVPILGNVETGNTEVLKKVQLGSQRQFDKRQLKIITGIVERSSNYAFRNMLWRVSHGNIYYKEASNDDTFRNAITGRKVRKVAFVIICYGDEMYYRIMKVCNGFNVRIYRWPEKHDDRRSTIHDLSDRLREMDKVIKRTKRQREAIFRNIGTQWEIWMTRVLKAKAIYHQLNMFNMNISSNTLIGQCWVPDSRFDEVESVLESTSEELGARSFMVKTHSMDTPPTYYTPHKIFNAFQSIISSYQIGRYKELNPAIIAIITFPFMFGVMFGDIGHGSLLFIYALWMINHEENYMHRRTPDEVFHIIFQGRYIILMMGIFSMFMGFLYNECFSLTLKLMPAYWFNTYSSDDIDPEYEPYTLSAVKGSVGYVYRYGIEPGIKLARNQFLTENSLKMKLSLIIGFVQITMGLLFNFWNYVYFKKYYQVFLHFLPKLVFILCIYGFLVYLIFQKWYTPLLYLKNFKFRGGGYHASYDFRQNIPSLRDEFIHFVLWTRRAAPSNTPISVLAYHFNTKMEEYDYTTAETILYHIAILCFPVMLFGPLIYLYLKNRYQTTQIEKNKGYVAYQLRHRYSDDLLKYQQLDMGHLFIRRLWRTLEFGFAMVSHIASYLHLWALSLAHSLMSRYLWKYTMRNLALRDFTENGIWKLYLVFMLWAGVTVFFLVVIESLAVFIHVLRLHWVEFMSKFHWGDGWPFQPFKLSHVVDERDIKRDKEISEMNKLRRSREYAGDYI